MEFKPSHLVLDGVEDAVRIATARSHELQDVSLSFTRKERLDFVIAANLESEVLLIKLTLEPNNPWRLSKV
jgi:hypothetical protein